MKTENIMMENKSVDLSLLMDEFNAWDTHVLEVVQENKHLEQKLELVHKENELTKERGHYLLRELKSARELVTAMQNTLSKRCDLEDENAKLKLEIQCMKNKMDDVIKEYKDRILNMETNMEVLNATHTEEMNDMKNSLLDTASEERASLTRALNEKNNQVSDLEKQLLDTEKEHQSEMMKLRLEYESKITALQKQIAQTQNTTAQLSASKRDIFRQKLQHQKAESEREIANLKRVISELQSKLDAQRSKLSLTSQGNSLSLSKRKRY